MGREHPGLAMACPVSVQTTNEKSGASTGSFALQCKRIVRGSSVVPTNDGVPVASRNSTRSIDMMLPCGIASSLPAAASRSMRSTSCSLTWLTYVRVTSVEGPWAFASPWSSHVASSHSCDTRSMLWVTSTIVTPRDRSLFRCSKQRRWNSSSPTAITSSTIRICGSTCTATENPSRTYMPLE